MTVSFLLICEKIDGTDKSITFVQYISMKIFFLKKGGKEGKKEGNAAQKEVRVGEKSHN